METTKQISRVPPAPIETADTLRTKAKKYMMETGMHGLYADRIVECIIAAAIMEMSGLMKQIMAEAAEITKVSKVSDCG